MAGVREPIVIKEDRRSDGSIRAKVQFLTPGKVIPRKIDVKFGERVFIISPAAQDLLRTANERVNRGLKNLGATANVEQELESVKPFDIGMAIYLYMRKHKDDVFAKSETLIDEGTMRALVKKFLD